MDASSEARQEKDQLRFVICGSEEGGKSTLLGRLLDEMRIAPEDGPRADREPGIAMDVAWHHFETARRQFIAADIPGGEQHTGNVAMGAASADLAVIPVGRAQGHPDPDPAPTAISSPSWASVRPFSRSTRWTWRATHSRSSRP